MFCLYVILLVLSTRRCVARLLAPRITTLDDKLANAALDTHERKLLRMHAIASAHADFAQLLEARGRVEPHISKSLAIVLRELSQRIDPLITRAQRACASSVADDPCLEAVFDREYAHCFVHRICAPDQHRQTLPCTALRLSAVQSQLLSVRENDPDTINCLARARDLPCLATLYDAQRDTCWEMNPCAADGECANEPDRVADRWLSMLQRYSSDHTIKHDF